ncbi:PLK protein kinase, partial [Gorgonomyces haynaldii]
QRPRPPSPPPIISDRKRSTTYEVQQFLGQGGFARCYAVLHNRKRLACKVVSKPSLKSQKQRQKLLSEIKIHQSLLHPTIVQFLHVFEDDDNVYMILELCENRTFVEMLKQRKRITDPEIKFYMHGLLEGVKYMHSKNIIHRDIKLGNLFLDQQMHLKIGDFGLAASIQHDGERKKTICGTPNYIAPEILFDQQQGHSFEVDIWSVGVVMYTLMIGKPPFQTKDVKQIYKKIRDNLYDFPDMIPVSIGSKEIVSALLQTKPESRPTIEEVLEHPYFDRQTIPVSIPVSALQQVPQDLEYPQDVTKTLERMSIGRSPLKPVQPKSQEKMKDLLLKPKVTPNKENQSPKIMYKSPRRSPEKRSSVLQELFDAVQDALRKVYPVEIDDVKQYEHPDVFITKWIDYSNKYGLGYQLRDGSVGVYFNDATSIILSGDGEHFEYLYYEVMPDNVSMHRRAYTLQDYPDDLKKKVTLLTHFRGYMQENLSKPCNDSGLMSKWHTMDFLTKYVRTKQGVIFRLSNHTLQLNMFDHTKLILSQRGHLVTYIDEKRDIQTKSLDWYLSRKHEQVKERLVYVRDVLEEMLSKKKK